VLHGRELTCRRIRERRAPARRECVVTIKKLRKLLKDWERRGYTEVFYQPGTFPQEPKLIEGKDKTVRIVEDRK
jgi:hypothetical protein